MKYLYLETRLDLEEAIIIDILYIHVVHKSNMASTTKTQEMLEKENDEMVHSLKHKVAALKSVSLSSSVNMV